MLALSRLSFRLACRASWPGARGATGGLGGDVGGARALLCAVSLAFAAAGVAAAPAAAAEQIESIRTEIVLGEDGAARVHHVLVAHAEGDAIQRGVFFAIPSAIGPVEGLEVQRDGAREPWSFEERRLRIGAEDVFLEPGVYTYDIRYRAPQPFVRGEDGTATLSWRPLAFQFELPWGRSDLVVTWPAGAAPFADGRVGADRLAWSAVAGANDETLTLTWDAAALPDAAVREVSRNMRLRVGAPLGVLFALLVSHLVWVRVGKDLPPGSARATLEPPSGLSAAATRYVERMSYDGTCLVAALVALVCKGALSLTVLEKKKIELRPLSTGQWLFPGERALLDALAARADAVVLGKSDAKLSGAMTAHAKALGGEHRGRLWVDNGRAWLGAFIVALVVAGVIVAAIISEAQIYDRDRLALFIGVVSALAAVMISLIYLSVMRAPTVAGRRVMDHIDGLREGLSAPVPTTGRDARAARFLELLPYAVALGAEEAWRRRFDADALADEAEDVAALVAWYARFRQQTDDGTFAAVILPAIAASTASASAGASGAAGASAGGW